MCYSAESGRAEFMIDRTRIILESIRNVKREINSIKYSEETPTAFELREIKSDFSAEQDISGFGWFIYCVNEYVQDMYDSLHEFKCQNDSNDEFVSKWSLGHHLEDVNKRHK